MKKLGKGLCILLALCLGLAVFTAAAEGAETAPAAAAARADHLSVTQHKTTIQGKEIAYTATAGTIAMNTDLGAYDMFFIAYTLDGVEDPSTRPITFAYNGGPGVAAVYVNLGFMGPDKLALNDEGQVSQLPNKTVPNDLSLLDLTDLVFIDPVGTGYSRAAGDTKTEVFFDTQRDVQSVGDFIRVYLNRYERWTSPRYLAGESYGTTRTAALCDYLMNKLYVELNGLMMISSCNNFLSVEFMPGNDLPYATFLPTYAAIAWHHGKTAVEYRDLDLESFMQEARAFAGGEYWSALYKGSSLTAEEKEAIAEKVSAMTGLKKDLILRKNLRIDSDTFCAELFSEEGLFCGRLDGRYTGPAVTGSMDDGDADPSSNGISQAFANAMGDILTRKLKVQSDLYYDTLSVPANEKWTYVEKNNTVLSQEKVLHDCMSKNPLLKVWVLCGYYDLATPFFGAEWTYSHLFLNEAQQKNLQFTYYPSGHMFYMHAASLRKFRAEAEAWYAAK